MHSGKQKMTVEHVRVNESRQTIVGNLGLAKPDQVQMDPIHPGPERAILPANCLQGLASP